MGFRRIDMKTLTNKQDIQDYKVLARRYTWCDKNISFKYLKEIGILLTSHPGNRTFLKASVESHAKTKLWITLAYDNYFNPNRQDITWDFIMPEKEVINKVQAFILSPYQKWGGVMFPYAFLLELGTSAMSGFKYIYSANGDCIIQKPNGIFELLDVMKKEDADFISAGWWDEPGRRPVFNSTGFIGRTEAVRAMMKHFMDNFIPLKSYERTCQDFGNCEGRMGKAIKDLGLKVVGLENPKNEQLHEPLHGDFCKILGFRHIHAEAGNFWKYKNSSTTFPPPELKYIDEKYMNSIELEEIKKWWKNNPKKD